MKIKIGMCSVCNEETLQDIGKKQATSKRGGYLRRRTNRCRKCGTRLIYNARSGNTNKISGKNEK